MRIAEVSLENVKSYAGRTSILLAPGINAICGENGAGKSTILEAIGFVLFGYRPYRLDAFLREGEKAGSIAVTVEDDGGCVFHVVRKLGSSGGQSVYNELDQRIAEGEADVRAWLLDFFRLEPGTDLPKLFEDTVGPPQGTLTAIFLESPGTRKGKFDRLLGVDGYRDAVDYLRSVTNLFRDQTNEAGRRAALLEGDVRRLPEVEQRLGAVVERKAALLQLLVELNQQQQALAMVRDRMEAARRAVQSAQGALDLSEGRAMEAARRAEERAAELRRAEEASLAVEASRSGYEAHLAALGLIRRLEERRLERDRLRQEAETAGRNALKWEQGVTSLEERLANLAAEDVRAAERELLVPEQEARERAVEQAREGVRAREEAGRQIPAVEGRLASARESERDARERLAGVEALAQEAARLDPLREQEGALRVELASLEERCWRLKQTSVGLSAAEGRLRQLAAEEQQLGREAEALLPLKALAEAAPERLERWDAVLGEVHALEARYLEALRSRERVEGGICPFLHEPCRNLRPGVSLDSHFDGVIAATTSELETVRGRLAGLESSLAEARTAEVSVVRLPDLERRLAALGEERGKLELELQRLEEDRSELSRAPDARDQAEAALAELEPDLVRAEAARNVLAAEEGWQRQARDAGMAIEREERALGDLRALVERESGAADALAAAQRALMEMKDPRGEAAAIRRRVERERPEAERALERGRRESTAARTVEQKALAALEPHARLDEEFAAAAAGRDESEAAHRAFLANQVEAERLPERRASHRQAIDGSRLAAEAVEQARRDMEDARAGYDEGEHTRHQSEMERVAGEIGQGKRELELCRQEEARLGGELDELRLRKAEKESAEAEAERCRQLMDAVEAVRRALAAAGPEIARALLRRVSAQATAIFRELLGQPAVAIEWREDYEIRCRVRSDEREFKQLSGGEQMSAALAVRLALLQTLSNLKLAFLDEPTAHMDAARRVNLATQIQNLRSFDQLVVISHDDSFDTLFGHVVRLAKRDGATVVEA